MLTKIIYFISNHYRIFSICIVLLFLAALGVILTELTVDNSIKIWYSEDDEQYQAFIDFQEKYGNDDIVTIFLPYSFEVYEKQAVADLLRLEDTLVNLDYVDRVYSYGSSEYLHVSPLGFAVGEIVEKIPENESEKQAIINRINKSPAVKRFFLTEDEKAHLIFIRLRSFEEIEVHRDKIVRELRTILEELVPYYRMGGMAVLNEALNYNVAKEASLFSIISYVLMIVLLAIFIRKKRFLPIAIASIAIPVVWTFGLYTITGQKLNMISMTLPTILIVYALADVVHIMNIYFKYGNNNPQIDKKDLIRMTLTYCFKPCFFTSATTMAAYISLYFSPIEVIKITGLFAFIGIGLAFISVYIIAIIGFTILKHPAEENDLKTPQKIYDWYKKVTNLLVYASTSWNKTIIGLFVFVFLLSIFFVRKIDINTYPGEYLSKKSKARQDMNVIESRFGSFLPFEAIVKCTAEDQIISRENLIVIDEFQKQINRESQIDNITSVTDLVVYLNHILSIDGGNYEIPNSDEEIIRLLQIYEKSGSNRLPELTNDSFTETRISGKVKMLSSNYYASLIDELNQIFDNISGTDNLELEVQGYMPLYVRMTNYITRSLLYSFLGAFLMIGLMMFVFLKNIEITLISITTNLIPILTIALIMVLFKIPLDMGTVMIAAIMFGITVDDTMHFLHAYLNNRNNKGNGDLVDNALKMTNPALLASSIALAAGFIILGMSSVKSLHNFGVLCAIVVVVAYAADVLLLSSILKLRNKVKRSK